MKMITVKDTVEGAIKDIQILGNTVQNTSQLSDIKSCGIKKSDGKYEMSILSHGKNLFDGKLEIGGIEDSGDVDVPSLKRSANYIKVSPNASYKLSFSEGEGSANVRFYDKNKKHIKYAGYINSFTTTSDTAYVRFYNGGTNLDTKVQLEEGTATSYEPYKQNKNTILLPCQLEKVGDIADRLYYDEIEKAWCIEKNVEKKPYVDQVVRVDRVREKTTLFGISYDKNIEFNGFITNLLPVKECYDTDIVACQGTASAKSLFVSLSKETVNTAEECKKYLINNNFYILQKKISPTKIILPLDTQIQLNSFFGTTHIILESGEVEGTVKAKVSKSLGASVQSLNVKTDILTNRVANIEGLADSQVMKYESDKGYLVCQSTKDGVVDDLAMQGRTLVNMTTVYSKHLKSNSLEEAEKWLQFNTPFGFKANKTYKIKVEIKNYTGSARLKCMQMCVDNSYEYNLNTAIPENPNGVYIFDFVTSKDYKDFIFYFDGDMENITSADLSGIVCLEKTEFEAVNGNIEGLKSVGEDVDKIEVLSNNNGSLISAGDFENKLNVIELNGALGTHDGMSSTREFVKIDYIKPYKFSTVDIVCDIYVYYYDFDKKYLGYDKVSNSSSFVFTPIKETSFIRLKVRSLNLNICWLNFNHLNYSNLNIINKQHKKQLLYYNQLGELVPVPMLTEFDRIEKHSDGKWYYHKLGYKNTFNGGSSENYAKSSANEGFSRFVISASNIKINSTCICDKFINTKADLSKDGVYIHPTQSEIDFVISNSKLETQDVVGFKKWLQANNVTVVYQLAKEEVYELAPLHLDSYANETMILCSSGAIAPGIKFSIGSHVNNIIKSYGERIESLEDKVYNVARLVLAGDMHTLAYALYPEDFRKSVPMTELETVEK